MYEIEKNVAIPSVNAGRNSKYPFAEMEPGDSFLVPCDGDETPTDTATRIRPSLSAYVRRAERKGTERVKFAIRAVDGGARVWRTA